MDEHFIPREYLTHSARSWKKTQFKEILNHLGKTLDCIKHSVLAHMMQISSLYSFSLFAKKQKKQEYVLPI